jgi:hypothetical protein
MGEQGSEHEVMLAERAITKAMIRYTRGIDRCDEELLRSAYHDDAYDDHGDRFRGPVSEFIPWTLAHLRRRFVSTMHTLHNIDIDVHGDVARAESYCIAQHVATGDDGELRMEVFACRYIDRFENRPGTGWRIADRVVVREWALRQPMVPESEQPPGFVTGRRDRDDLSYAHDLPRRAPTQ